MKTNSNASLSTLELRTSTPFIDFHYNNSTEDYTSRIIETASGRLQIIAPGGILTTNTLQLTKGTDLSGTSANNPALMIGSSNGDHIEFDPNEIHAKATGTTVGPLYLNNDGGLVDVGPGGLNVKGGATIAGATTVNNSLTFKQLLRAHDGVNTRTVMWVYDDGDEYNYGAELLIGGQGNTYIGAGESVTALYSVNGVSSGETMYITSDSNILLISNCNTIANRKGATLSSAAFYPNTNGGFTLGTSSLKWGQVYSTASSISTSDRNQKHDINELDDEKSIGLIMGLNPVTYKYNDGTSNRTHWGLIAQDIETLLSKLSLESSDFAGFIKSPKEKIADERTGDLTFDLDEHGEIQYEYGLRYEEFIAPLIKTVQIQQKQIERLETEINLLKSRI